MSAVSDTPASYIFTFVCLVKDLTETLTGQGYIMVTPAPKSLQGLQKKKNEKLTPCLKKKSHKKLPVSYKFFPS